GDAPRSYWRFDEPSGPLVDVQGYKNGSYVNAPTRSVSGLLPGDPDQAASFDGSTQYADVPADPAWTASPFTLEVLVRPSQLPVNKTIWSTIGPNFTGWWLNTGPNGQVRLFVGDGSAWQWQDPNVALAANTRYDIAATYDGTNARLYLNGALISTGPATTMNGNVAGSPMRSGAYSTGPGQYWPGTIDDASFYPSALSASLIAAHYNAGLSTPPSAASSATAVVSAAAPAATAPPVVTGSAVVGATLTTTTGTWTGTPPLSYTYRWRTCATGGASCSDLANATSASYVLQPSDQGRTIRAVVTAANAAGQASSTSAATGVVAGAGSPVTVSVSASLSADDGDVGARSPVTGGWPPSGAPAANTTGKYFTVGKRNVFGDYQAFGGLVRFDTSSLPDNAQITGATLTLYVNGKANADNRNLIGSWYDTANWPIDAADYAADVGTTALAGS